METLFEKIWELALPYQDKRDDKGHAEVTLCYAFKLLESEDGDKDVIIPAIILHDIGWSQLSKYEKMSMFDSNISKDKKLQARYNHQDVGVNLGRDILNQVDYSKKSTGEILEIISQHDTREGFVSQDEGCVRDADKLWRFSETGFRADLVRNDFGFRHLYDKLVKKIEIPNFSFSDKAKEIAYGELKMRKKDKDFL